jgi:ectoine hydroxylase-related dioxygenase (phytanoyl-CoA dioxygenase family)
MDNLHDSLTAHLQAIENDGFSIIENAIDNASLEAIRRELAPFCQGQHPGRNNFEGHYSERVYALLAKAPSVAKIIEHADVLALVDKLLPKNYLLSAALAILVHPGETPQPFHYDDAVEQLGIDKPRPRFGVSTIWAFDDFTENNGATEVIPGSHRWPEARIGKDSEVIKVIMTAGSVLVFDGALIHRGGANHSSTDRLAITPQYCSPGLRQIENMVLAVPPNIAGQYSAKIQNMLGYNIIEPGFKGYVDGMHPKKLIDAQYKGRKYQLELPAS